MSDVTERESWKGRLRAAVPDFARKVAPLYAALDWRWEGRGIPSESEIARVLHELIDHIPGPRAAESMGQSCFSGGLRVWWKREGESGSWFTAGLSFEVSHEEHAVVVLG
jgi:hypothetical protein